MCVYRFLRSIFQQCCSLQSMHFQSPILGSVLHLHGGRGAWRTQSHWRSQDTAAYGTHAANVWKQRFHCLETNALGVYFNFPGSLLKSWQPRPLNALQRSPLHTLQSDLGPGELRLGLRWLQLSLGPSASSPGDQCSGRSDEGCWRQWTLGNKNSELNHQGSHPV